MKKSIYLFFTVFVFLLISCASKPKVNQSELLEISSPVDTENGSSELNDSSSDDISDGVSDNEEQELEKPTLEEVVEDVLPELPTVEEENDYTLDEDKSLVDNEPEVKDDVEVSSDENDNTDISNSEIQSSVNSNDSATVDKTTEVDSSNNIINSSDSSESTVEDDSKDIDSSDELGADTESESTNEVESEEKKIPVPSRTMTVKRNQLIDIVYPGKGWIYQENIDEQGNVDVRNKNFIFGGRKLGGENQAFTLRSRVPGKFLLHFYKNDVLTGNYIDDYLEVVVENEVYNGSEHTVAPNYAEFVPPKAVITADSIKEKANKKIDSTLSESSKNESGTEKTTKSVLSSNEPGKTVEKTEDSEIKTVIQTSDSAPNSNSPSVVNTEKQVEQIDSVPNSVNNIETNVGNTNNLSKMNSDELLKKAKDLYSQKEYAQAFDVIQLFFDKAVNKIDEGLFLQAQILEAKSSVQNIKSAVDSYDLVVKNYPTSKFWNEANKRSIYLKRFYINIR